MKLSSEEILGFCLKPPSLGKRETWGIRIYRSVPLRAFDPALRGLIASKVLPHPQFPARERPMALKFKGVDFIEFDTLLNDDERLVRDNTRKFIEENLVPIIEQCNRDGRFPKELIKPMGELGFYGASLKGYGCAGMSNVEYGLM